MHCRVPLSHTPSVRTTGTDSYVPQCGLIADKPSPFLQDRAPRGLPSRLWMLLSVLAGNSELSTDADPVPRVLLLMLGDIACSGVSTLKYSTKPMGVIPRDRCTGGPTQRVFGRRQTHNHTNQGWIEACGT